MLIVNKISFISDGKRILKDVSFSVDKEHKVIVGENGTGKTTLLEIIIGNLTLDSGNVLLKGRVGYIPQEIKGLDKTGTEVIEEAFPHIKVLERKIEEEDFTEKYGSLIVQYESIGGYTYKQKIYSMMDKFRLTEEIINKKLRSMSGGERTKCFLIRVLLSNPDILIMDEPTNHLDIESIETLEENLKKFKKGMLIVSHDETFINHIATHILHLSDGKITEYRGNYEKFKEEKEKNDARRKKEKEKLMKYIEKEKTFIEKFRYGTRATQAKSREKKLQKIEMPDLKQQREKKIHIEMKERGGEKVAELRNIVKSFGDKNVLKGISLLIKRGERIGILGRNGSGKSTLLKIIAGKEKQDSGIVKIGNSISIGYFPQDAFVMDLDSTPLNEIISYGYTIPEARNILALFDFTGDEVFKKIREFSGGEKRKLLIAKMSLIKGNFLVLDEPTNHLSIRMKEMVIDALENFNGTILLVTHDRYVLNKLINKKYYLDNGKLHSKQIKKEETIDDSQKEINKIKNRINYLEKLLKNNPDNTKRGKELKMLKNKLRLFHKKG